MFEHLHPVSPFAAGPDEPVTPSSHSPLIEGPDASFDLSSLSLPSAAEVVAAGVVAVAVAVAVVAPAVVVPAVVVAAASRLGLHPGNRRH